MLSQLMEQLAERRSDPLDPRIDEGRINAVTKTFDEEVFPPQESPTPEGGNELGAGLYGEMECSTLGALLETIRVRFGDLPAEGDGVFVDAGSGAGRACLAAASLRPWKTCRGVEIVPGLVRAAESATERWRSSALNNSTSIDFIHGDALDPRWYADADVVFCCWLAWPQGLSRRLLDEALTAVRPGAWLITAGYRAPSAAWRLYDSAFRACSWGSTNIYMHRHEADFPRWRELHLPQLTARGVPEKLWPPLCDAFVGRRFRAGDKLQLVRAAAEDLAALREDSGGGGSGGSGNGSDAATPAGEEGEGAGSPAAAEIGGEEEEKASGPQVEADLELEVEEEESSPLPDDDVDEESELLVVAHQPLAAESDVFLIDHAWTFRSLTDAKACLAMPDLAARVKVLTRGGGHCGGGESSANNGGGESGGGGGGGSGGSGGAGSADALLRAVVERAGWYQVAEGVGDGATEHLGLGSASSRHFFFLADEVGSCMATAADEARVNFRVAPLFCLDERECFSVAWPVRDVPPGGLIQVAADAEERRHVAQLLLQGSGGDGDGGWVNRELLEYMARKELEGQVAAAATAYR